MGVTRFRLLALVLMMPALPASAQDHAQPNYEITTSTGAREASDGETVALGEDELERMTVPVGVAGSGPYHFLVDTGSNKTIVSRQLAERLRLAPGRNVVIHSLSGPSTVVTAGVARLDLSGQLLTISDAPLLEARHLGADGILGLDSLRSQRVIFDFRAQTMNILRAREPLLVEEQGTVVVRARRRLGHLILTDAAADGARLQVVIDTGAQVSVGNEALRQALARKGLLGRSSETELRSVTGGTLRGDYVVLDRVQFGGVEIRGLALVFADAHTFRKLKLDRTPALMLGMNALRAFDAVSIDFGNRKLRLRASDETSQSLASRRAEAAN